MQRALACESCIHKQTDFTLAPSHMTQNADCSSDLPHYHAETSSPAMGLNCVIEQHGSVLGKSGQQNCENYQTEQEVTTETMTGVQKTQKMSYKNNPDSRMTPVETAPRERCSMPCTEKASPSTLLANQCFSLKYLHRHAVLSKVSGTIIAKQ